ncbi:MAG: bifunctional DNA-formamidopyrimidine glycosylase/DNA-(apurinic or apyrimidinic site) lyase [Pseudomonadota bacterium]
MPELPEVETVRRGLEPVLAGKVIRAVDVRRPDLRWPFPDRMEQRLAGARILALRRRSKYILADLSTAETLIVHLGMTGRMLVDGQGPDVFDRVQNAHAAHDHVVFGMEDGAQVTFNDARRFGAMDLHATDRLEAHWLLSKLGPEPLGNAFSGQHLADSFKNRKTPVKSALLDQRIVAGLGNIYVCEALWRAAIHPRRHAGRISRKRLDALYPAIRDVLTEAIDAGGSSLRDFRQANGELGYFQHAFAVYGREGEDCVRANCSGTILRIVQSGRSSFYCNSCQR